MAKPIERWIVESGNSPGAATPIGLAPPPTTPSGSNAIVDDRVELPGRRRVSCSLTANFARRRFAAGHSFPRGAALPWSNQADARNASA
jgi:hypothetical protein